MPSTATQPVSAARRIADRGGRATPTRLAVLEALGTTGRPLSHDEIAGLLHEAGVAHDRVTLYRTLDWLVANELAHRVAGGDRVWRFNASAAHGHAHFHCQRCGGVYCLESMQPVIAATLPPGFELTRAELNFHGHCPSCH
jgi:Fur family ferric uptake transcriptional regulator